MIHEAMALDHSGPLLGVIHYGASMKLLEFGAVLVRLVMPIHPSSAIAAWGLFIGLILLYAVAIGIVESVMARLQMRHVHRILVAACLLSGFGIILLAR
jgi:formate hydrogenlyase subunit 4